MNFRPGLPREGPKYSRVIIDHVSCGKCKSLKIERIVQRPYGDAEGKYITEVCIDCRAFRVIHDDWANWRPEFL